MAMGACRCRPEAERHSAAAATGAVETGAVETGAAVTNSSLPVDMVLRSSTGIPLTGTIRTATTAIKGTATATPTKGTATTAIKGTATATPTKGIATAKATKGITTATATKGIATASNGRSKKGKYVSEADAIKAGDRPARSHYPSAAYTRTRLT